MGVHLDTSLSFNVHCEQVTASVKKQSKIPKVLVGSTWGQQRKILLITYKAIARSIVNYAELVWSTNASKTSLEKIQVAPNEALGISSTTYTVRPRLC